MVNAYAHRSTDPKKLREVEDPVGPENDRYRLRRARRCESWAGGKHAAPRDRGVRMAELLSGYQLYCMGVNRDCSPVHPLYVASAMRPVRWRMA